MRIPLSILVLALFLALAASSPSGATGWQVTTVDPVTSSGRNGSMRLDAGGEPRISSWVSGVRYTWHDAAGWHAEQVPFPTSPQDALLPAHGESALEELPHPANTELLNWLLTSIALDAAGQPRIAWTSTNDASYEPSYTPIWYASRSSTGWTTEAAGPERGEDPSLDIDANGRPSIAYANAWIGYSGSAELHFVSKDADTWSAVSVIDPQGWQPSLRVDAQGVPHVAYSSPGGVRYATLVSGSWVSEPVASGYTPSLAFGPDGEPRIAYVAGGHVALAEHKAGSWILSVADSLSGNDTDVSLAVTPMGEPRIAYRSLGSFRPWFAERNFSQWTTGAIDASADGYNEEVGVDGFGRAFISWSANDGLRWAQRPQVTAVPVSPSPATFAIAGASPIHAGEPLRFQIDLARAMRIAFDVFDAAGRSVAHREVESLPAGSSRITWSPSITRPGLYLVRASDSSHSVATLRLVVLR